MQSEAWLTFLEKGTSACQVVREMEERLAEAGYERLYETQSWQMKAGGCYYVVRSGSSLIAFRLPEASAQAQLQPKGYHIVCAHSDSPCLKIKENPQLRVEDAYLKLNVEKYGGMIAESWFDRPLSVAGRLVVKAPQGELQEIPVDLKRPLLVIPSLAAHMRRGGQEEKLNPQLHLLPLAGAAKCGKTDFMELLAQAACASQEAAGRKCNVQKEDILGTDLYVYVYGKPVRMGLDEELIGAPRLDDLLCAGCGLEAMLAAAPQAYINVLGIFDNEEVGSKTMQGADSDFLQSVLLRISLGISHKEDREHYQKLCAGSFLLSADNAHAMHPNYVDKADPTNRPVLGGGIVIKYHAGQKYTTDGYSGAYVKSLCERAKLSFQTYHNRSDQAGGSTLGNLATSRVSMPAADVGIAQLAMHAAFETACIQDVHDMERLMEMFFSL